jgi:hypothetical protein
MLSSQVAFDPLDGSSIFSANFAVGSIFGIWKGSSPLGQTGRDQVAAAYSIYGPRTLLVVAVPAAGAAGSCTAAQPGQQQPPPQQQQSQLSQQPPQAAGLQQQQQQQQPSQLFDVLEFALCSEGKRWKLRQVWSGHEQSCMVDTRVSAADRQPCWLAALFHSMHSCLYVRLPI